MSVIRENALTFAQAGLAKVCDPSDPKDDCHKVDEASVVVWEQNDFGKISFENRSGDRFRLFCSSAEFCTESGHQYDCEIAEKGNYIFEMPSIGISCNGSDLVTGGATSSSDVFSVPVPMPDVGIGLDTQSPPPGCWNKICKLSDAGADMPLDVSQALDGGIDALIGADVPALPDAPVQQDAGAPADAPLSLDSKADAPPPPPPDTSSPDTLLDAKPSADTSLPLDSKADVKVGVDTPASPDTPVLPDTPAQPDTPASPPDTTVSPLDSVVIAPLDTNTFPDEWQSNFDKVVLCVNVAASCDTALDSMCWYIAAIEGVKPELLNFVDPVYDTELNTDIGADLEGGPYNQNGAYTFSMIDHGNIMSNGYYEYALWISGNIFMAVDYISQTVSVSMSVPGYNEDFTECDNVFDYPCSGDNKCN